MSILAVQPPGLSLEPQDFDARAQGYLCGIDWNPGEAELIKRMDREFYHPWARAEAGRGTTKALDVGCGPGLRTDMLRKAMGSVAPCTVVGCDASEAMVKLASAGSAYGNGPVPALRCDVTDPLPFEDGEFGLVTMQYATLSHIRRERAGDALLHIRKVQPRGGLLLLDVPLFSPLPLASLMLDRLVDLGLVRDSDRGKHLGMEGIGHWPFEWKDALDPFRYLVYERPSSQCQNWIYLYGNDGGEPGGEALGLLRSAGYEPFFSEHPRSRVLYLGEEAKISLDLLALAARRL